MRTHTFEEGGLRFTLREETYGDTILQGALLRRFSLPLTNETPDWERELARARANYIALTCTLESVKGVKLTCPQPGMSDEAFEQGLAQFLRLPNTCVQRWIREHNAFHAPAVERAALPATELTEAERADPES